MNKLRSIIRATGKLKSKLEIRQAGSKMRYRIRDRLARRKRKEDEKDRKEIKKTSRPEERKEGESHCKSNKENRILSNLTSSTDKHQVRRLTACYSDVSTGKSWRSSMLQTVKNSFSKISTEIGGAFLKLALLRKFVNKLFFFDLRVCKFQKVHEFTGNVYSQRETRN